MQREALEATGFPWVEASPGDVRRREGGRDADCGLALPGRGKGLTLGARQSPEHPEGKVGHLSPLALQAALQARLPRMTPSLLALLPCHCLELAEVASVSPRSVCSFRRQVTPQMLTHVNTCEGHLCSAPWGILGVSPRVLYGEGA